MSRLITACITGPIALAACIAIGQEVHSAMAPLRMSASEIAARPALGAIAGTSGLAGIRTIVLAGDPAQAGPYTIELLVPAHTRINAHEHRDDRTAVVVSGIWHFGYGDSADDANAKSLGPGSVYTEPANLPHFAHTEDEPVAVVIIGNGPTDTRYLSAAAANAAPTRERP